MWIGFGKAHGVSFREVSFAPHVTEFEIGAPYIEICAVPFGPEGALWLIENLPRAWTAVLSFVGMLDFLALQLVVAGMDSLSSGRGWQATQ